MPSARRAQCTEDCRCLLCRELKGCKMSASGVEVQPQIGNEGSNFILRRAVPFLLKSREEWREVARHDDYERSSTLEDRSRRDVNDNRDHPWTSSGDVAKTGKDLSHRTVIYFGDSNPRQKEDKARQQQQPPPPPPPPPPLPEASVQVTARCNEGSETSLRPRDASERDKEWEEDTGRCRDSALENGDPKAAHEIVVNVSPSREDVLRIEEDESQLEDYWSLPGDTSGFKADWSFVQQWRLRG